MTHGKDAPLLLSLLKLARPKQWAKSAFVFIGPLYAVADGSHTSREVVRPAIIAAAALAIISSACYILNDVVDAPRDRLHPRKQKRPIASGAVTEATAILFACVLLAAALACIFMLEGPARLWVGTLGAIYALNTNAYSFFLKRIIIADVICLSLGFVIRVLAGCGATGVHPTTWLLNCTLFLAMFLAFGKRLGERRTMGEGAATTRAVQGAYTDELLRMMVVVTAVATLITYAGYVQSREATFAAELAAHGLTWSWFNPLWLTMLPAIYGMMRAIVLTERGTYEDPTEMATRDWPTALAAAVFVLITVGTGWWLRA